MVGNCYVAVVRDGATQFAVVVAPEYLAAVDPEHMDALAEVMAYMRNSGAAGLTGAAEKVSQLEAKLPEGKPAPQAAESAVNRGENQGGGVYRYGVPLDLSVLRYLVMWLGA